MDWKKSGSWALGAVVLFFIVLLAVRFGCPRPVTPPAPPAPATDTAAPATDPLGELEPRMYSVLGKEEAKKAAGRARATLMQLVSQIDSDFEWIEELKAAAEKSRGTIRPAAKAVAGAADSVHAIEAYQAYQELYYTYLRNFSAGGEVPDGIIVPQEYWDRLNAALSE